MAAKTSASAAFNSYFYQQHTTKPTMDINSNNIANTNGINNNNINNEPVSDLHLKMSKKIAQLTKVVYALNSKNDESEILIANLKAQYEDEKDQLMLETNKKLEEFKTRLMTSNDNSKKINELESKLREFQNQKEKAIKDFESFKIRSIENEENLTIAHREELIDMNKMLEELKFKQEKQSRDFERVMDKYNTDKQTLIEELNTKHRNDMENLKKSLNSTQETYLTDKFKMEEKHQLELNKLKNDLDSITNKFQQEKLEYEQNMNKLKLFHQKELDANRQNSNNEYQKLIENLKFELEKLNKEKILIEKDLNQKYTEKLEEIITKEEEIQNLKEELDKLKSSIQISNSNETILNKKFADLEAEYQATLTKLTELEFDNNSNKNRCEQQARTLIEKSSEISKLEVSELQKNSIISDLKHELGKTKERLNILESDKKNFENESMSLNDRNIQLIRSLEAQLNSLNKEKETILSDYDAKLVSLNDFSKKEIENLKTESLIERQELVNQYESKLSTEKALFEEKLLSIQRDLKTDFNTENQKLLNERNDLKSKLEQVSEELKSKTKFYENDLKTLNEKLIQTEKNLNKLHAEHDDLGKSKLKIENDYNSVRETSRKQILEIENLKSQLEQVKVLYQSTSMESQLELKVKLEMLSKELNAKWTETLRIECETLRKELQLAKEEEKQLEIERLNNLREEELRNQKSIWQTKTNELLNEISILKRNLNEKEFESNEKFEKFKQNLENENKNLNEQLKKLNDEYNLKLEDLKSQQSNETKTLIDNLIKENEEKIAELKQRHLEDLKSQTIAQKAMISSLKSSLETSKKLEIDLINEENEKKIEFSKQEVEQKYHAEIDKQRQENERELLTIRIELNRAIEISRDKEREIEMKNDEFQSEMRFKQKYIDKLTEEIKEMKNSNLNLKEEVEIKIEELKQIKYDFQHEIKTKEALMQQRKEEEINRLNLENMKQKQLLVNEFKQAQEILKNKIHETENALRELHDRFLKRESRAEDLEMIKALKRHLADRDELLRKLNEEKKYFQMELVNRENNFNKVFNVIPNVGTINPLNANTKIKSKGMSNSSGKLTPPQVGRLDPIPGIGSPLHDLTLNPNKPLPKKFLS